MFRCVLWHSIFCIRCPCLCLCWILGSHLHTGALRCTLGSEAQHTHSLEYHTWSVQQSTSTHTKQFFNIYGRITTTCILLWQISQIQTSLHGSRTWISLDIARFYEEQCQPSSVLPDRCDSYTACMLCRMESVNTYSPLLNKIMVRQWCMFEFQWCGTHGCAFEWQVTYVCYYKRRWLHINLIMYWNTMTNHGLYIFII